MPYNRPYPGGFQDFPNTTTPINSSALNTIDVGVKTSNDQFQTLTTAGRTGIANPVKGQFVFDSDLDALFVYSGSVWVQLNNLGNYGANNDLNNFGPFVFTDEAARDAAITSPSEGMVAYLTAPTVPAATGASTFVPTGIQTIYNGSVWVCVTPVSALTAASGTTTSTSFTATLSGTPGTNPTVTLVTGTTALVHIRAAVSNSNAAGYSFVSVSINGSTPTDDFALFAQIGTQLSVGTSILFSGLTAGTNTFVMQYSVNTGTGTFQRRGVTVQGIA